MLHTLLRIAISGIFKIIKIINLLINLREDEVIPVLH
jgi:hypothetical protein